VRERRIRWNGTGRVSWSGLEGVGADTRVSVHIRLSWQHGVQLCLLGVSCLYRREVGMAEPDFPIIVAGGKGTLRADNFWGL